MTSRELVVALVVAVLLGGAFIGVLGFAADDPPRRSRARGLTHDVANVQEDFAYHDFLDRYSYGSADPSGQTDPAGH
jgi:hypothetical protein